MPTLSSKWGIPPIEKIHEAFSAIADGRVKMASDHALVSSSDYRKEYTVSWQDNTYSSNDNASYFQGYMGYPVIAVLMLQKKIDYSATVAEHFKGINWKELNTQYKNQYAKAVRVILNDISGKGIDVQEIESEVNGIYEQIKTLDIIYKRSKTFPPK